jgi:hypothetical protein
MSKATSTASTPGTELSEDEANVGNTTVTTEVTSRNGKNDVETHSTQIRHTNVKGRCSL